MRIAAGAGAWGRADVSVCLVGPAAVMLEANLEPLQDEQQFAACLPILREPAGRIYVLETPGGKRSEDAKTVSIAELAELAASHDTVVRF